MNLFVYVHLFSVFILLVINNMYASLVEIVGALVSVLVIWVLSGVLVYQAIIRLINQNFDINADIMLTVAGLGVAVNVM